MIRVIIIKKDKLLLSLGRASLKFFSVISWAYLKWGGVPAGAHICRPPQALVIMWSYLWEWGEEAYLQWGLSSEYYGRCS